MWRMDEREWLAERFEAHRRRLRAVAYRMLGSVSEADDAVQEAWIRLSRADTSGVENLAGWLTTVVARVCLDMLRSRKSRREEALTLQHESGSDPEHEVLLADSVGLALLVVLETLAPAERVAFVLHDMFDLPFDEIAPIMARSPNAARQLASRARRRVRGTATVPEVNLARQREVVDAFLDASRRRRLHDRQREGRRDRLDLRHQTPWTARPIDPGMSAGQSVSTVWKGVELRRTRGAER